MYYWKKTRSFNFFSYNESFLKIIILLMLITMLRCVSTRGRSPWSATTLAQGRRGRSWPSHDSYTDNHRLKRRERSLEKKKVATSPVRREKANEVCGGDDNTLTSPLTWCKGQGQSQRELMGELSVDEDVARVWAISIFFKILQW